MARDVMVEDEPFARQMEQMYLDDLNHATEIVLDTRKVRLAERAGHTAATAAGGGSAGKATAAALRIGNAVAAAVTDSRVLEPVESQLLTMGGLLLLIMAVLIATFPGFAGYTVAVVAGWVALSLLYRAYSLHRQR